EGPLSSALCHLGNISYRLGRVVPLSSGECDCCAPDKDATETIERMRKHVQANGVKLDEAKAHVGLHLALDAQAEKFRANDKANAMLTREYRKGRPTWAFASSSF